MTKVGITNYTWDNNGNLTNNGSTLYRYDQANRMISTTLATTTTLFNYNGDGVRLKQVIAGVPTTYTQDIAAPLPVVLQARTGTTATQYLYSMGTRPVAQYTSSAWQYLLPDALGSVRQIVDASSNILLTESYQPYGSLLNSSGSASSIFAYAGEQLDISGLIFLRARYMNPGLGIFLSHDPYSGDVMRPGSMNGFGYGLGNPVYYNDPNGLCVFCKSGDAIRVDGRVNGQPGSLIVRARPNDNALELVRIPDLHRVRIGSGFEGAGEDAWREVYVHSIGDGNPSMDIGWVRNISLLDNCDGPVGVFACIPSTGDIQPTLGFGPNQWALDHCGHPGPGQYYGPDCKYTDLRGLHDGLDFDVAPSNTLVWMGGGDGTIVNRWPVDASPNIEVEFSGNLEVVFGHISSQYRTANTGNIVRAGQAIGESGGTHLHLGVRNGRVFYNPLNYFAATLQARITAVMDQYPEPYGPYAMVSFDADAVPDTVNFWTNCTNLAGIVFTEMSKHR